MRRREAMAERFHEEQHLEAARIAAELAAQASQPNYPILPPGVCPKCGEHVGRAFREHTRICAGPKPVAEADRALVDVAVSLIVNAVSGFADAPGRTCVKCGKVVKPKGIHSHTRNCKGAPA
jgi:hypothetical protein